MSKPVIYYVDDDEGQVDMVNAIVDHDSYDLKLFSSPLDALTELNSSDKKPSAVLSDQKMSGMDGISFLKAVHNTKGCENTKLVIVTAYSELEDWKRMLKSGILFGFITKPYSPLVLQQEISKAYGASDLEKRNRNYFATIGCQKHELEVKNLSLAQANDALTRKHDELVQWVHPLILKSIEECAPLPDYLPIAGVTFDVIEGSKTSGELFEGSSLHSYLTKTFTSMVLKYGGWQESQSGDSAFGHFHLNDEFDAFDASLAAAREFRTAIINLNNTRGLDIRIGIGLHFIPRAKLDVNAVASEEVHTKKQRKQKFFTTSSLEIDLLHRIENYAHKLMRKGNNILLSKAFYDKLTNPPETAEFIGEQLFKGQDGKVGVYLLPDFEQSLKELEKSS